ncbi:MAG: hypothetical protein NC395_04040 [Prevotella sp.]|nr:hypothetical protein [Prevotella sp.]
MSGINCKKIALGTVIAAAVSFSSCTHDGTENGSTETSLSAATSAAVSVTAADTEAAETEYDPSGETELVFLREYFKDKDGFSGRYIENEYGYELTLDMSQCKNPEEVFSGIDRQYLDRISSLIILNLNDEDIGFVNNLNVSGYGVSVKDYGGSADFGCTEGWNMIIFDGYRGGDLSTVKSACIRFKNYSGEYPLNGLRETGIENYYFNFYGDNVDFGFLKDCPNVKLAWLSGGVLDTGVWTDVLENSGIERLIAEVTNYSEDAGDALMKAAPTKSISYGMYTEPTDREKQHSDGLFFYTNVEVTPNYPDSDISEDIWSHHGSLVCRFSNFTDEAKTAERIYIIRDDGYARSVDTPIAFRDGSAEYSADFTVNAGESADFDITDEIFDFAACEQGTYKVIFDFGDKTLEQRFFIGLDYADEDYWDFSETSEGSGVYDLKPSFMNAEQREVFSKAYAVTRKRFWCSAYLSEEEAAGLTADEFLAPIREAFTEDCTMRKTLGVYINEETGELQAASWDGGTNPEYMDGLFFPVYSDENELIFKVAEIHAHDGDPFRVWVEEENFHMVNTENGWRFDKFDLWY